MYTNLRMTSHNPSHFHPTIHPFIHPLPPPHPPSHPFHLSLLHCQTNANQSTTFDDVACEKFIIGGQLRCVFLGNFIKVIEINARIAVSEVNVSLRKITYWIIRENKGAFDMREMNGYILLQSKFYIAYFHFFPDFPCIHRNCTQKSWEQLKLTNFFFW